MANLSDLNDDSWALDLAPAEGQASLAEPSVVDMQLRIWAKFLLDTANDVALERKTQEQAISAMAAEAGRMQSVFYGGNAAFKAQPTWNRPQNLGAYLVGPVGLGGDPADAPARLFRAFWSELAPNLAAFQNDEMDEETFQDVVAEELIERYRHYLMGVPLPPDYTGDEE